MSDPVPHDIRTLADARARARRARDWSTADRLKAELEAAGWKVVDAGTLYSLVPLAPATVEVDGQLRYGTSEAVPSRLEEPDAVAATAVLVADDVAGVLGPVVAALRAHSPGTQVVVVANAPSPAVAAEVKALEDVEVVRLASRLGAAAARNAGIRRALGTVVVLLSARLEEADDLIGTLAAALADPSVALAGVEGLATGDFVHFEATPPGVAEADTVDLRAMAFRRADYAGRGPLDEHFTLEEYLDAWWGFMLRDPFAADGGPVGDDDAEETAADDADTSGDEVVRDAAGNLVLPAPRRAVVVKASFAMLGMTPEPADERLAKKHRYRFLKAFASRRDLLTTRA